MFKSILVVLASLMFAGAAFADPPGHQKMDRRGAYFHKHPEQLGWEYNKRRHHPRFSHHKHSVRIYQRYGGRDVLIGVIIGGAVVAILTADQYERHYGHRHY